MTQLGQTYPALVVRETRPLPRPIACSQQIAPSSKVRQRSGVDDSRTFSAAHYRRGTARVVRVGRPFHDSAFAGSLIPGFYLAWILPCWVVIAAVLTNSTCDCPPRTISPRKCTDPKGIRPASIAAPRTRWVSTFCVPDYL